MRDYIEFELSIYVQWVSISMCNQYVIYISCIIPPRCNISFICNIKVGFYVSSYLLNYFHSFVEIYAKSKFSFFWIKSFLLSTKTVFCLVWPLAHHIFKARRSRHLFVCAFGSICYVWAKTFSCINDFKITWHNMVLAACVNSQWNAAIDGLQANTTVHQVV